MLGYIKKIKGDKDMTTVLDILSVTDENMTVIVMKDGCIVSMYDGRDSIDEKYNKFLVNGYKYENNTLYIYI